MANQNLFATIAGKLAPKTNTVNEAGGRAYALTPKQALAQYAATGCLPGTFWLDGRPTEGLRRVGGCPHSFGWPSLSQPCR